MNTINEKSMMKALGTIIAGAALMIAGVGCEVKPSVMPVSDPALKRTSAQFAADAAKRFPFHADLPAADGNEMARAMIDYSIDVVNLVNLSKSDMNDFEVWINRQYVVSMPSLTPGSLKRINFRMFFDDKGNHFPLKNSTKNEATMVHQLEIVTGGKIYTIPIRLGL